MAWCGMMVCASWPVKPLLSPRMVRVERNMRRSRYSAGSATPSSFSMLARSRGTRPRSSRSAGVGGTTPSSRPSTRGVPSGAAMDASSPTRRQAGLGTLKLPEWTSRRADSSVSSRERMPRAPKATVGRPLASLGPSVTRTRSAASRSRCCSVKGPKCWLPISSSPSKMNFTATRGTIPRARMSSIAVRCAQIGPLSSEAPRPYSRWPGRASSATAPRASTGAPSSAVPARRTGSNGEGWSQPAGVAGLTS